MYLLHETGIVTAVDCGTTCASEVKAGVIGCCVYDITASKAMVSKFMKQSG
jgi:hypothetical protein